jgi:hypothetical protein
MVKEKEVNILEEAKPKTLTLADGKEYKLPPIDMTTLANMEKTMGFGLGRLGHKLELETITTIRMLIYALIKENYPEADIDSIGRAITLREMKAIAETISEIMAMG